MEHGSAFPLRLHLFGQEFTAPVGWGGIEDRFRKCPRMSPWVEKRALAFAVHVILRFSENTSPGRLGTLKELVDRRDTKCDVVRPRTLLGRRSGVRVDTGLGDDDGPVAVHELTASVGIAETYGEWQSGCEPLDCFARVGVVEHGYYGAVW
jgi:hypothetical protein